MKPLTSEQRKAVKLLYDRSHKVTESYRTFRRRFQQCYGDYIGGQWCNMFIGIELDGYTHS